MKPIAGSFLSRMRRDRTSRKARSISDRALRSTLELQQLEDRAVPSFALRVSTDGGATFGAPVLDNGPGDINPAAGAIVVSVGPINLLATSSSFVSTGLTTLNLQLGGVAGAAASDLAVQATVTDVTTAPAPQSLSFGFTGSVLPGPGTVAMRTWADNANAAFGTTGGGIAFDSGSQPIPASAGPLALTGTVPYSLTTEIRASFTGVQSISLNDVNSVTASPERDFLVTGDTATIGFWNNKNGQALINSLNGGSNSKNLSNWLATTFPNIYGANAGANNLTNKTNTEVASFFQTLFGQSGQKLDAQVLAVALAMYVTNKNLAGGMFAANYGFNVGDVGTGVATYNIGSNGAAFGVPNDTTMTVLEIMQAANAFAVNGVLWNGNTTLRNMGNDVFSGINQNGDIA